MSEDRATDPAEINLSSNILEMFDNSQPTAPLSTSSATYERVVFSTNWHKWPQRALKRALDIVMSGILLVFLSPVFIILAFFVRRSSPGPIFYRWYVAGKGGRPFMGYKFRSMYTNADEIKAKLAHLNEMRGPAFKITGDPRITPVGVWMRRHSLDELPQLYNVFKGDMSLVGPRPPLVNEYERFTDFQKQKLLVKPGLTCIWQVSGRNQISDYDEWVKLDLEYIRRWSFWLDLQILILTVAEVTRGSGK